MKGIVPIRRRSAGTALLELLVSVLAASAVLGSLISASVAIRRSITATDRYAVSTANETRLMDYVARDLRRAVRVGMLVGGTNTPLKNYSKFPITGANTLTISVPDFYAANSPNNAPGSPFKSPRYPRATLNTSATYNKSATAKLNGIVPWSDAVMTVSTLRVTRFAPATAGTGELQVRYYRGARSASDSTICFFRAEYPSGATSPSEVREIAERVVEGAFTTGLFISGMNNGRLFRLESSFHQRYRRGPSTTAGTEAFVEVSTRNPRRD